MVKIWEIDEKELWEKRKRSSEWRIINKEEKRSICRRGKKS